ncbi:MAG: hypothetical protein AABX05_01820 [Nanoarchaeota archaeon]
MGKVLSLKKDDQLTDNQLITSTLKLMGDIESKLVMTRNQLKNPPLGTVIALSRELLREKIEPALADIKKAKNNIERLKNLKIAVEKVGVISDLADDVLIDLALFKKDVEKITQRSDAMPRMQAAVRSNFFPAIS